MRVKQLVVLFFQFSKSPCSSDEAACSLREQGDGEGRMWGGEQKRGERGRKGGRGERKEGREGREELLALFIHFSHSFADFPILHSMTDVLQSNHN